MAIYEILEKIMVERHMSIADVARICNLPDSTVRGIIRRKQENVALDVAFRLSDGLDVSLEKLNGMPERLCPIPKSENAPPYSEEALKLAEDYDGLDGHGKRVVRLVIDEEKARCEADRQAKVNAIRESREQMEAAEETACFILPYYLHPSSAGTGEYSDGDEWEELTMKKRPPRGASYVIRVHGDSMEPTYYDGDKVFVRAGADVMLGQIGIFIMDKEQYIKELGDGVLISHNPDPQYAPRPMVEGTICQGLVLGVCDESYFE